jgi:hypothetical protein
MMGSRRAVLRALAALAVAFSLPGAAQDAKTSAVQNAAREWLALVDALDAAASWKAAGARYRSTMTEEAWAKLLSDSRAESGPLVQRSVLATTFQDHFDSGLQGDFALVLFRTSFEKRIDGRETLTLEREADGKWRVVGYSIQ